MVAYPAASVQSARTGSNGQIIDGPSGQRSGDHMDSLELIRIRTSHGLESRAFRTASSIRPAFFRMAAPKSVQRT